MLISSEVGLDTVMAIDLDTEGRVAAIYLVRNPEKLAHVVGS